MPSFTPITSHPVGAPMLETSVTMSASIDAAVQKGRAAAAGVDAAVQMAGVLSASMDSQLVAVRIGGAGLGGGCFRPDGMKLFMIGELGGDNNVVQWGLAT